jgi:phosphoribosylaminoimidazole-succinocarboxamide synthase
MQALTKIDLSGLEIFSEGKVRTVYDLGEKLLIVASDRISAFDFVLPSGIPDKGKILTGVAAFWFRSLGGILRHHMLTDRVEDYPHHVERYAALLRDRSMLVMKADRIDIECIVRGYLTGSAWNEYSAQGTVAGQELPPGLEKDAKLGTPLFTPSTKSDDGHDRNITMREMCDLIGPEQADYIVEKSLGLYAEAARIAGARGITVIDTKFEFGYLGGDIILIDEALTPDSSRFWMRETSQTAPINVDKQFIRDYLAQSGWDKNSSPPVLPAEIIAECRHRYLMLYEKLTGSPPQWLK